MNSKTKLISYFKPSWTPIDELNCAFGLDCGYSGRDVFGHDISSIQQTTCHVFTMSRVAFDHLISRLEGRVGDLSNGHLLVESLFSRHDGRISNQRKVNPRVWHKIGLEFGEIDVERAIESQRCRYRAEHLGYDSVYVGVGWPFNAQVARANVINGLIVDHERAIRVL